MPSDQHRNEFTARQVADLPPGQHRVAPNLYLNAAAGGGSWVLIYASPLTGRRREMGLGSYPDVTVPDAKAKALRHRVEIIDGRCPLAEKQAHRAARPAVHALTFRAVADRYLAAHEAAWRHPKQAVQWTNSLATYAYPVMGELPIGRVTTAEVMLAIEPIWHTKPETASRVRGRIEAILDYATARHWRQGDNPARWRGHIAALLPSRDRVKPSEHFAAVPWRELPALWTTLRGKSEISAIALRFTLLTCVRTNEALGLTRAEIDFAAKVWTVPARRTKSEKEHRVPLSAAALAELDAAEAIRSNVWQFSGARVGRPLSNMAMLELLRGICPGTTVHGTVRSGFRDWAAEHGVPREVAEAALAHTVANKVEAAYLRNDLLEPRRAVMTRWAKYLATPAAAAEVVVVPMRA